MSKWERVEFDQIKVGDRIKVNIRDEYEIRATVTAVGEFDLRIGEASWVSGECRSFYRRKAKPPKEPPAPGTVARIDFDEFTCIAHRVPNVGVRCRWWTDDHALSDWEYIIGQGANPRVTVLYTPDRDASE